MNRRKDNRGRVLNTGESQRSDGKYVYQYTNIKGQRKSVYAWRLTPSDTTPNGKHKDLSLREKEKQVQKDISDGIVPDGGNLTVLELAQKYVSQKKGVKYNTECSYSFVLNILEKEDFATKRIDKVRLSDTKEWFVKLQNDGRGYSTMQSVHGIVRPAFQMAVEDDLLRKNPFDFQLSTVVNNDSSTREAITKQQETQFLEFVRNDKCFSKYYDGIFILFNTGMRISEFCGLTLADVDLKNRKVNIDHQLQRTIHMEYYITDTKTTAGTRQIPMPNEVYECFKRIVDGRKAPKVEPMVDGHAGFLYLDREGKPMTGYHWDRLFDRMVNKYNKTHKIQLPRITPHVCRHTYCSNMAKCGMNPKTLQYLMGHSNIGVTLNTYTHLGFEDAKAEILSMQNGSNAVRKSV